MNAQKLSIKHCEVIFREFSLQEYLFFPTFCHFWCNFGTSLCGSDETTLKAAEFFEEPDNGTLKSVTSTGKMIDCQGVVFINYLEKLELLNGAYNPDLLQGSRRDVKVKPTHLAKTINFPPNQHTKSHFKHTSGVNSL